MGLRARLSARDAPDFQLPLSGSHCGYYRMRKRKLSFQLPLSGSRSRHISVVGGQGIRSFNSLSRDHVMFVTLTPCLASSRPFNSLSRDHKLKKYRPDVIRLALDNFQLPLSGSHHIIHPRSVPKGRTNLFQLPLSGSLRFTILPLPPTTDLSTPSLGITIT